MSADKLLRQCLQEEIKQEHPREKSAREIKQEHRALPDMRGMKAARPKLL
jgi:hypothetical protein